MNDNMSQYSGIAASYANLPLIALRELESVLKEEIRGRLAAFGVVSKATCGEVSVGDVEEVNVAKDNGNCTKNNVLIGNFKGKE